MKSYYYLWLLPIIAMASCAKQVYNNNHYLSAHNLSGKKLAILPAEVFTTGIPPSVGNIHDGEEQASLDAQLALEQAYRVYATHHRIGKKQQPIELLPTRRINQLIAGNGGMPADSMGRLVGADLVLKIRILKIRYMSETLARGINIGTSVLDAIVNTTTNNWSFTTRMKAYNINYQVSLIDVNTGEVIAVCNNTPEDDKNGNTIEKCNRRLVKYGAVYPGN